MASNNAMRRPGKSRGLIGVLIAVPIGLVGGGMATFFAYRLFATPTPVAEVKGTPTKAPAEDRQEPAKKLDPPAPEKDKSKPKTDPPPKKEAPDKQSTPPADAKSAQELADTVLRHVNTYRKIAGLGTVQVDAELSKGCAAHAKYIALNPPNGPADAANVLKEDPAK